MIGTHLGERYELTTLVQEGPIFATYNAKDKVLGRDATVRVVKPPFSAEQRFLDKLREVIKGPGSVEHPGIERVLDLKQEDNLAYLISEPSKGSVLAERIRSLAPYSVGVSVSMTVSILEGLEALHSSGFVHGDAGAHNVMVQPDGTTRVALPGIWEAYAASETAAVVMLPAMAPYLAPEVTAGEALTPASDTYSVGVMLFQLLTGQYPYAADTPVAMAMKHAQSATPSARTINSAVPAGLDDVVRRSMAKDPADRYADAGDMLEDLRRIEDNVRFGKGAAGAKTQPVKQVIVAPSDPEAPKMAEKPRAERKEVEEREPGDVPIWMIVSFTFVLAVAVALIGVWWFFNTNAPKIVKVPEVRGKMRSDAEQILNRRKLQLRIAGRESSEKLPADTVLKVDPEPGQQVREGGTVAVTLSTGSRMVTLPDLRGKSQEEARQILTKLNLDLDGVNTMQDEKLASGLIGRQAPGPKSKVERFTRVNIWVSSGPSQPPRTNPTAAEARYLYTMRIRLTRITNPVVLKVEITDAKGTRQIYEAEHYPNEDVTVRTEGYGPEAVFRIYYDGELVSQVTKRADEGSPAGAGDTAGGTTGDTTGDNGDGNP